MIHLRLDERLMHGQVTTTWIGVLGVTHIIVADNKVAADTVHCQLLKMSVPQGIRLMIGTVEKAVNILNDSRCNNMKILVICSDLDSILKIVEEVPAIKEVNLANYGFQANPDGTGKQMLTSNLQVDTRELEIVKNIMARAGIHVYCQVLANQPPKTIIIK